MLRFIVLLTLLAANVPSPASAQARERQYVGGIRSALIVGSMKLSDLDPAFADLAPDGPAGPHISGFFFMYRLRPHLRIGIETLVSSSDPAAGTAMNYQAAGPVVDLSYGTSWFVAGGLHAGGLIVNAVARDGSPAASGAATGSFYKGDGMFVAPSVDVGYRFTRGEAGLFVKRVDVFGGREGQNISAFGGTFAGLRFGIAL